MENGITYKKASTSESKTEIQKKSYLLQMKFFCKTLVCRINREFSAFPKLKNPKLFGRIATNLCWEAICNFPGYLPYVASF